MPGRLDFEHELHDEAENAVKDMEFGLVLKFGGEEQPGDGGVPAGPPASAVPLAIQQQQQAGTSAAGTPASATAAATPDTPAVDMKSEAKMEVDDDGDDDDEAEDEAKLAVALDPTRSARGVAGGGGGVGAGKTSSKSTTVSSGGGSKQPLTAVPGRLLDDGNVSSTSSTPEPSSGPLAPPTPTADSASSSQTPAPAPPPPPPPPPPPAAPATAAPIPVNTDSPDYLEDPDDLELKLTILEIYNDKLDRRAEAKSVIFQRGLMEHKKVSSLSCVSRLAAGRLADICHDGYRSLRRIKRSRRRTRTSFRSTRSLPSCRQPRTTSSSSTACFVRACCSPSISSSSAC